jgi:hypothetical protein
MNLQYNTAKTKSPTVSILALAASVTLLGSTALAGPQTIESNRISPPAAVAKDIWVHPITRPYWHEDSFVTTDLRLIHAYHHFPGLIFGGGSASVTAAQLRVRLLPNLQLVAYKVGWMDIDTAGYKDDGFNDIAVGLKWAFLQDDANQFHAALGIGYEFASGDDNVLQDDDEVRFWASVNKGFGKFHLGATLNYGLACGNGDDVLGNSNHLSWHLHADYQLCKWFSPVIEVNGYHVLDEGDPVTPFSGADVLNLGGNKNEDVITVGFGSEVRPLKWLAIRAAYELPITDNRDLFRHRWTFSAVISF